MKHWVFALAAAFAVCSAGDVSADSPDFYAGFQNAPSSAHIYRYRGIPDRTLGLFVVLPQLYLFDGDGHEIASHRGEISGITAALDGEIKRASPLRDGRSLNIWMQRIAPVDSATRIDKAGAAVVTVIQYWAPWCEYCFEERDQLLAYITQHPQLTVNWITVDADLASGDQ